MSYESNNKKKKMTTNNSDTYFDSIDKLEDIRYHKNLDVYDTLVPLWLNRNNYSKVEKKLIIAIHELYMFVRERDILTYKMQKIINKIERNSEDHTDLSYIQDAISNNQIKIKELNKTDFNQETEIIELNEKLFKQQKELNKTDFNQEKEIIELNEKLSKQQIEINHLHETNSKQQTEINELKLTLANFMALKKINQH